MAIKGNADLVSKEIRVSSFLRLHVISPGQVAIYKSDTEKVIIETDQNLVEYVDVENSGRTLYIASAFTFKKPEFTVCRIKVFLRNLDTLQISHEEASVVFEEELRSAFPVHLKIREAKRVSMALHAPFIHVLNQSTADMTLTGKCNRLHIKNQGDGIFDAGGLQAEELHLKNGANGPTTVHADKAIEIHQSGDGPVYYSGNAVLRDICIRGEGEVKHIEHR